MRFVNTDVDNINAIDWDTVVKEVNDELFNGFMYSVGKTFGCTKIYSSEEGEIDVMQENKSKIDIKNAQKFGLTELFDQQIKEREKAGYPEEVIQFLNKHKDPVTLTALKAGLCVRDKYLPFMPVIPFLYRDVFSSLKSYSHNGQIKNWRVFPEPSKIIDKVKTPVLPYYMFDISENETTGYELSVVDTINTIIEKGRLSLTIAEVLAFCIDTDLLYRHQQVAALMSREKGRYRWSSGIKSAALTILLNSNYLTIDTIPVERSLVEKHTTNWIALSGATRIEFYNNWR